MTDTPPTAPTASLEMRGHVGLITMHDAHRHNAMTASHVGAVLDAIAQSRREGARAVVIASGVKNFCAGADVKALLDSGMLEPGPKDPSAITSIALFRALLDDPRPVIAAIHGLALGGGLELALCCDLVVASSDARFGMPELGLGVLPRTAMVRLARVVGYRRAMELILTRRKFSAPEAQAMGLVNAVSESEQLVATAVDMAASIVTSPPTAIAAVKRELGRVEPGDWEGFEALLEHLDPSEWREGLGAMLAKREPDFEAQWKRAGRPATGTVGNKAGAGALAGLRVLDLSTVVMGPYATQILGDHGADVIKVESPEGDVMRYPGPSRHGGMGAIFLNTNRNKRSIALDLRNPLGREALLELAKTSDVLVYNLRPNSMARLQLSYEDLRAVNPRLIYVGAFGFGQEGPYAARPAFDDVIQAACALPDLSARTYAEKAAYLPINVCDRVVGLHLLNAILIAVVARARTGQGQSVEVPMFETMTSFILGDHLAARTFELEQGEMGYARIMTQYRRPFRTRDGHMCIIPYIDQHWKNLLAWLERPELIDDPRFATHDARSRHIDEVYGFVDSQAARFTNAEWEEVLQRLDIPHMRVHSMESLLEDEHLRAVGLFERHQHPTEDEITVVRPTTRMSATPPGVFRHAPRLGEHTDSILQEAGFSAERIAQLREAGAAF